MKEAHSMCPEPKALRQYLDGGLGAQLPKWAEKADILPR